MHMRSLILPLAILFTLHLRAQEGGAQPVKTFQPYAQPVKADPVDSPAVVAPQGDVTIEQDARIAKLMDDFAKRKHVLKGYRVQIFLGSERESGKQIRRDFLLKHVDVPAYEDYLAPNFRVRVGDCRTRLEAAKLLRDFKAEYPGAYGVPDEIEMPRLAE